MAISLYNDNNCFFNIKEAKETIAREKWTLLNEKRIEPGKCALQIKKTMRIGQRFLLFVELLFLYLITLGNNVFSSDVLTQKKNDFLTGQFTRTVFSYAKNEPKSGVNNYIKLASNQRNGGKVHQTKINKSQIRQLTKKNHTFLVQNKKFSTMKNHLSNVHSGVLVRYEEFTNETAPKSREDFLHNDKWCAPPPYLIAKNNAMVTKQMARHLLTKRERSAIGVKWKRGSAISNGLAICRTFLTPIASIHLLADPTRKKESPYFPPGYFRRVIMLDSVNPDLENSEVVMKVIEVEAHRKYGHCLTEKEMNKIPTREELKDKAFRTAYDKKLQSHVISHLMERSYIPSLTEVDITPIDEALAVLEECINNKNFQVKDIKNLFIDISVGNKSHVLSAEAILMIYIYKLFELEEVEKNVPQGYIYMHSPPHFFTKEINYRSDLLNCFQALAFKLFVKEAPNKLNLKVFACHTRDEKNMERFTAAFEGSGVIVRPKKELVDASGFYDLKGKGIDPNYAMVIPLNGDAFGQNIETEGKTSKEGLIGCISDGAKVMRQNRNDLLDNL